MKAALIIGIILLSFTAGAQTLEYNKGKLTSDGQLVAPKDWEGIFQGNEDALTYAKKAKTNYNFAQGIGFVGGFLIGWPLGTSLGGGDPEWAMAGAGAGLIVVAIPLSSAAKKNINKAIQLKNGESVSGRANFDLIMTGNKVGIRFQF